MQRDFMVIDPEQGMATLKGLASPLRVQILKLLHLKGPMNVNDIASELSLPQSTVSINVQILEDGALIRTENQKARKGNQKICFATAEEVLVVVKSDKRELDTNAIEVAMPIGLYTSCEVTSPCGLCTVDGIIGLLDVPNSFLDPDRMKAGLIWFTRGYVEYQFPNNAKLTGSPIRELEVAMELSSEVPGTASDWPSDITLTINGINVGTWTSPGDFGDKRGVYTPSWWKLKGSQYGKLKNWRVCDDGTYIDGLRISDVGLGALDLLQHHSIRIRIGVRDDARHPGGMNIFGRGFGNYDQDVVLRIKTE
ncbi:MAG: helix-turn-helix domain-containing protein [Ancalomicrobiaceae bacterium]|nr:helix-turn-helix domain-containing protein [Ancalomicrobiaceae bacterium]